MSVNVGPQLQFATSTVSVFQLVPTGAQSGTVLLEAISHGRATPLQQVHFVEMSKPGSIAVQVSGRTISLSCDIKAASVASQEGESELPKRAVASGTAWGGTPVWADGSTSDCWEQEYFIGTAAAGAGGGIGDLRLTLQSSRQHPTLRFYCLAIKLDGRPGNAS